MDSNLILLERFTWAHEYNILKTILESNGIEVFMRDELTINVDPLLSYAIGGIKMYVKESDFETASKIVKDFYDKRSNDIEEEECSDEN